VAINFAITLYEYVTGDETSFHLCMLKTKSKAVDALTFTKQAEKF
jgi:hypothetical protein